MEDNEKDQFIWHRRVLLSGSNKVGNIPGSDSVEGETVPRPLTQQRFQRRKEKEEEERSESYKIVKDKTENDKLGERRQGADKMAGEMGGVVKKPEEMGTFDKMTGEMGKFDKTTGEMGKSDRMTGEMGKFDRMTGEMGKFDRMTGEKRNKMEKEEMRDISHKNTQTDADLVTVPKSNAEGGKDIRQENLPPTLGSYVTGFLQSRNQKTRLPTDPNYYLGPPQMWKNKTYDEIIFMRFANAWYICKFLELLLTAVGVALSVHQGRTLVILTSTTVFILECSSLSIVLLLALILLISLSQKTLLIGMYVVLVTDIILIVICSTILVFTITTFFYVSLVLYFCLITVLVVEFVLSLQTYSQYKSGIL